VVGRARARYYGARPLGPGLTPPRDNLPADPQPAPRRAAAPPPGAAYVQQVP
jgi:hypothetical protein